MPTNWNLELEKLFPEEDARKTFAKVFDEPTVGHLHALALKGYFDCLEYVISTGKEAHVFRAVDTSDNFRAVKIYKTSTSDFKHMMQYVRGDNRFAKIKHDKLAIVKAWTQKEFKNLELANTAGISVPLPIAFRSNVLVMEFIGDAGEPAPRLKERPLSDSQKGYDEIVKAMAKLMYGAKLIHADLSEYNILNRRDEPVLIDMGQAVLTTHPSAQVFFERDLENVVHYFNKQGVKATLEETREKIRSFNPKTKKHQ